MSDINKNSELTEIEKILNENHLGMAIKRIEKFIESKNLFQFRNELESIASGYKYMVEFLLSHGGDSGRATFFNNTKEQLRRLMDKVSREIDIADSIHIYFSQVRTLRLSPVNLSETIDAIKDASKIVDDEYSAPDIISANQKVIEHNLINLFNYIWTSFPLTKSDGKLLSQTACDSDAPFSMRAQIISANMLALLQYYDRERIDMLLDTIDMTTDSAVKARAMIALVIGMYAQRRRVASDAELKNRLSLWVEDADNAKHLRTVVLDIVRTLDTERINKELREEFLPKIEEMRPHLSDMMKGNIDGNIEENPEWEKMMKESGLEDKLKELTELQNEGADLMMFAFSNLKNFGFFNELSNWFLPFDSNHTQLNHSLSTLPESMIQVLNTPGMMCDSDKYSFALSLSRMPESQRDMLFTQLGENEAAINEAMTEITLAASSVEQIFSNESMRYLRDINRFLKLFREHRQFRDMLRHPFMLNALPLPPEVISSDVEFLRIIGEYYLRRDYFEDAAHIFSELDKQSGGDPDILEKLGYCYHKLNRNDLALDAYRKAELFEPDSKWLIKRIASVSRRLRKYSDASEYYARALENEPENRVLLMNAAACLVELGKYSEALKLYYKVNYLNPSYLNSLRAIAWTEFLAGNFGKSNELHARVLAESDATTDKINAGHALLASGKVREAVEMYRAATTDEKSLALFNDIMKEDRKILEKIGCSPLDIAIIEDRINTSL